MRARRFLTPVFLLPLLAPQAKAGSGERLFERFELPVGPEPVAVVTADFDGEGDLDAACASRQEKRVHVFLVDPSSGFDADERVPAFVASSWIESIVAGDLDGDGDPDLVVCDGLGCSVLQNDGTGTFAPFGPTLPVDDAFRVALVDLDHDQDLDLVVGRDSQPSNPGSIVLFLNTGGGVFAAPTSVLSPITFAHDVAAGDLDADGNVDLVVSGDSTTNPTPGKGWEVLNNQGGSWVPGPFQALPTSGWTRVQVVDLDGIGGDEVVIEDGTSVLRIQSTGHPTLVLDLGASRTLVNARAADVDGDGDLDLVVLGGTTPNPAEFALVRQLSGTSWAPPDWRLAGPDVESLGILDLDGKGSLDFLIAARVGAGLSVVLNPGGSGAEPPRTPLSIVASQVARSADLDLDGDLDLVVASNDLTVGVPSGLQVALGDGRGRFDVRPSVPIEDCRALALADVNGDGLPDALYAESNGSSVWVAPNSGNGSFGAPTNYSVGLQPEGLVVADLDEDGDLDFATADTASRDLVFRWNDGAGGFGASTVQSTGSVGLPTGLVAADVDLDGHGDLVVAKNNATVVVYRGLGNGTFVSGSTTSVGAAISGMVVGDLDSNGLPDLVIASNSARRIVPLLNSGSGAFATQTSFHPGPFAEDAPRGLALADLDRDGRMDLVVTLYPTARLLVARGLGNGAFGSAELYTLGGPVQALAIGDFDRDALPDLAAAIAFPAELVTLLQARPAAGSGFCAGDGSLGPCPCGNSSAPGGRQGCLNSTGIGAELLGTGCVRVSSDSLRLEAIGLPASASSLFLQGNTTSPPTSFGDGLLCLGGSLVRIALRTAAGGAVSYPTDGALAISVRGGVTAGQTLGYQTYYRNAAAFCTPSTFNVSSGLVVVWSP